MTAMTPDELLAPARFDACERDAGFAAAMSAPPPPSPVPWGEILPGLLFLIPWTVGGGWVVLSFAAYPGFPVALFPIGVVGGGVAMIGSQILRSLRRARATGEVERCLVVVTSRGQDAATLGYRDGKTRRVGLARAGVTAAQGEIGVGHVRDGVLVAFVRLGERP